MKDLKAFILDLVGEVVVRRVMVEKVVTDLVMVLDLVMGLDQKAVSW